MLNYITYRSCAHMENNQITKSVSYIIMYVCTEDNAVLIIFISMH